MPFENAIRDTVEPDGDGPTDIDLSAISGDTELIFGDGEFIITERAVVREGDLAFRAAEGANPTLVAPDGFNNDCVVFKSDGVFVSEGIDVDVSDGVTGMRVAAPRFYIADMDIRGRGTHPDSDVTNAFTVNTTTEDGEGIIRNVSAPKGSTWARYKRGDGREFVHVGPNNLGQITVEGCRAEEFGNNGVYASASPGPIVVKNCEFWNNNVSNFRFGSEGSKIVNSTFGVDTERYSGPREDSHEASSWFMRAAWIEAKKAGAEAAAPVPIIDSTITVRIGHRPVPTGTLGVVVRPNGPGVDIQRTTVDVQIPNVSGVTASPPGEVGGHGEIAEGTDLRLADTTTVITHGKSEAVAVQGRNVTVEDRCCIEARGEEGTGVCVEEGMLTGRDSRIVGGTPCVSDNTDLSNVETEGGCSFESPGYDPPPTAGIDPPGKDPPTKDPTPAPPRPTPTTGSTTTMTHQLTITRSSDAETDDPIDYALTVMDDSGFQNTTFDIRIVNPDQWHDANPGEGENDERTVSGKVGAKSDVIEITGALESATFSGPVDLHLDGEPIDQENLVTGTKQREWGHVLSFAEQFGNRILETSSDEGN